MSHLEIQGIENLRNEVCRVRYKFEEFIRNNKKYEHELKNITGSLTTIISSMYATIREIIANEIKHSDLNFGKGYNFISRGLGKDHCSCFVCRTSTRLMDNISGFVNSKEEGEYILNFFDKGARLDYRNHSPNHIQVKIGACDYHYKNLLELERLITMNHNIIREHMVKDAINI